MKKVIFLFLLLPISLFAQQNPGWSKITKTFPFNLATNEMNEVIVAGDFVGSPIVEGVQLNSQGAEDLYVAKYDEAGNFLWINQIGCKDWEYSRALASDKEGNVYYAFITIDTMYVNGNLSNPFSKGFYLFKFSPTGNLLWHKNIGDAQIFEIAVDEQLNVYITGSYNQLHHKDTLIIQGDAENAFVAKYDQTGAELWAKVFDGPTSASIFQFQFHAGRKLIIIDQNQIAIGGTYFGYIHHGANSVSGAGTFVALIDSMGNPGDLYHFEGATGIMNSMEFIADDFYFNVSGYPGIGIISPTGNNTDRLVSLGLYKDRTASFGNRIFYIGMYDILYIGQDTIKAKNSDMVIAEIDLAGNIISYTPGGSYEKTEEPMAMVTDSKGNLIIAGLNRGTDFNFAGFSFTEYGGYIIKFDSQTLNVKTKEKRPVNFSLFPNPAKEWVTVNINLDKGSELEISLLDINGKTLKKENKGYQPVGASLIPFSVNDVPPGIYFIKVQTNEGLAFQKLIVGS
ncbi:MAG: T9SS type A sorting domain-containing protein [Bacteroidetes bacterium]|nr:T9SS type A sorting domain-containing protein [Bacteroidota bacterium]